MLAAVEIAADYDFGVSFPCGTEPLVATPSTFLRAAVKVAPSGDVSEDRLWEEGAVWRLFREVFSYSDALNIFTNWYVS